MDDPAATRKVGGRYRLVAALGAGGMGTVWRAYDELLGREVAVKEVRLPHGLGDEDREVLLARTMREARTAAQLDEVHVVRVYDVVEDDHRPWIVMELVEGTSLGQRVRVDGPLPSPVVAQIGLSVLSALAAAHAAGILHRDVKPSNVVLAEDGRVVLTDFGVATAAGEVTLTATGMLIGSPSYLSPERARGQPGGPASDLWSLGATLYAAVEGRPPFERGDALSTITAAIVEPHDPPTQATPDLQEAIDGLLAKEPDERLGLDEAETLLRAAAGTSTDLRPLAAPEAARAVPPPGEQAQAVPPPAVRTRPVGRRRLAVLALATALAAGAAVAVVQIPGLGADTNNPDAQPSGPSAGSGTAPTPGATTPSGTGASVGSSSPAVSSTPVSSTPVASTPPASSPAEPGSPGAPLPDGFALHEDETGFSVGIPIGWTVSREGPRVDFDDPAGGRFLRIDQTDTPQADPYDDWIAQEPAVAARLSGYQRIEIAPVDYRDYDAADWEFTHGTSGTTHVLSRNLVTSPTQAYAIYWSVDDTQWEESLAVLDVITASFQPAA